MLDFQLNTCFFIPFYFYDNFRLLCCALVVEKEKYGVFNQNRKEGAKDLSTLKFLFQFLDFNSNALVMKLYILRISIRNRCF